MEKITLAGLTFLLPYLVGKFESKIKPIKWLSPVVCCYALGILLGNLLPGIWDPKLARTLSEVSVMLALPLLLLSTDFLAWLKLAKTTIISFVLLIFCVMVVSYIFGKLFDQYDPEVWKMAGMLVGVYVGGTANLTAIGKILDVREEVFVMLNAVEVMTGGIYLLFILTVGVKILTKWLVPFKHTGQEDQDLDLLMWQRFSFKKRAIHSLALIGLSAAMVGISLLISNFLTGTETASVILLGLTVMALGLSFLPKIRHFEGSQEWGQYLLLVFCLAVGSMANASQLLSGSGWYFAFCTCILLGSVLLHFLCCFFLKIDRDTAIITSMAGIYGPAFVAPMCQVLKNRGMLVAGVTTGLVGIAVGNFVGVLLAYLLKG